MRYGYLFVLFSFSFFFCTNAMRQQRWRQKNFWKNHQLSKEQQKALKRKKSIKRTVSLIIPCYYKHAPWLYNLLAMYEYQTRLPDEVIISLSEAHLVDPVILNRLMNERWAFPIKLIVTDDQKNAGENRNIACSHARGDIFVCQDADDIIHKQRIEIIHYFFTQYAIDHLMHEFQMLHAGEKEQMRVHYNPKKICYFNTKDFEIIWDVARFTNGNVAISRSVFEKIKWPAKNYAEDTDFNREVYKHYSKNCVVIQAVLYGYRQYLSSHAKKEVWVDVEREVVYTKKLNQSHAVEVIELRENKRPNLQRNVA